MKGPWHFFWYFILVVLLSFWAASVWIIPLYLGIIWILLLLVAFMLLLIAALVSPSVSTRRKLRDKLTSPHFIKEKTGMRINTLLWLLILFLATTIIIGYVV